MTYILVKEGGLFFVQKYCVDVYKQNLQMVYLRYVIQVPVHVQYEITIKGGTNNPNAQNTTAIINKTNRLDIFINNCTYKMHA